MTDVRSMIGASDHNLVRLIIQQQRRLNTAALNNVIMKQQSEEALNSKQ